jgi:hypothetical protein
LTIGLRFRDNINAQNIQIQKLWGLILHSLVSRGWEFSMDACQEKHGGEGGNKLSHDHFLALQAGMRKRIRVRNAFHTSINYTQKSEVDFFRN